MNTGFEEALKAAHYFGTEAEANSRKYISKDDRDDIALCYGEEHWRDIPKKFRKRLLEKFYEGMKKEKNARNSFS